MTVTSVVLPPCGLRGFVPIRGDTKTARSQETGPVVRGGDTMGERGVKP